MDWNSVAIVIAAFATAIAAILTPVITTAINNKHQCRHAKEKIVYYNKAEIYDEFFSEFGKYHALRNFESYSAFLVAAYRVLLICDRMSTADSLKKLVQLPDNIENPILIAIFMECADMLHRELKNSKHIMLN